MKLENFIAILVALCIFAFGLVGNKYLNLTVTIIISSLIGLAMFGLTVLFLTDKYYKLKNRIKNSELNLEKLKKDFEIEKRLTILGERLNK